MPADAVSFGHCNLSFRRVSCAYSDYVCMLYSFIINGLLKLFGISLGRNNINSKTVGPTQTVIKFT